MTDFDYLSPDGINEPIDYDDDTHPQIQEDEEMEEEN